MSSISVACNANWNFKLKIWPHVPSGSGSVDISVSSTSAALTVGLNVSNLHPQMSVQSVSLNVGNIDMSFHGSLLDWILDLFKGMIENAVKSNLDSVFGSAVSDFITTDVNSVLMNLDLDIPINAPAPYNISEARFGIVSIPTISSTFVGISLQGDVVPLANPVNPPITPPNLPPFSPSDGSIYISAAISPYTLVSALYTYLVANTLTWTINSQSIPLGFNNTGAYTLVAPGFPSQYPNAAVQLNVAITALPTITMTTGSIATVVPMTFIFEAQAPNSTFVNAFGLNASASLSLSLGVSPSNNGTSYVITGSLGYLDADLGLAFTNVGTVNVPLLQALVNITFSAVLVPIFDELLAHGLPLPQAPGMTLTSPTLVTGNGYVTFGCNFTFDPTLVPEYAQYLPAVVPSSESHNGITTKLNLRGIHA